MSKCCLKKHKQCCCNCIHHWPVNHHCTTEPETLKPAKVRLCVCDIQKGWACVNPEISIVHDNWPLHSIGCECYTEKPKEINLTL